MFILSISVLFVWILFVFWKFVLKPYLRMRGYKDYKGAEVLPFVPVLGVFKLAQDAYQKTGDENYEAKRAFQKFPGVRLFVFNALDKCFINFTEPNLLQQFFQKQENYIKEESFLQNRIRFFGQGVAFTEGSQWSKRRKILSSLFHFSLFNNFVTTIQTIVDRQITELEKSQKNEFQAKKTVELIAGDIIIKAFFGVSFNQKIQDQSMAVWLSNLLADNITQQRSIRYFLFGVNILKLGLFAQDRTVNNRIKIFRAMAKNVIQSKLASNQIKGTMLQVIKEKGMLGQQGGYKLSEVIDQFMGFYVAGVDTTSHFLTMAFYYLVSHTEWQLKLREEIKESRVQQNFEFKAISALKYLQFFIKQTFRHYDYMVSLFPRRCIKSHTIAEITIKQGDIVMPGWCYLNYRAEDFTKPHEFEPLRWEKIGNSLNPYTFTPFSIGSRSCLGQNFALLQIKIVLIRFLLAFEMKLKPGYEHKLKTNSLYGPINPMYIQVESLKGRK